MKYIITLVLCSKQDEEVLEVELMSKENKDYWILRGAALLMQLDD